MIPGTILSQKQLPSIYVQNKSLKESKLCRATQAVVFQCQTLQLLVPNLQVALVRHLDFSLNINTRFHRLLFTYSFFFFISMSHHLLIFNSFLSTSHHQLLGSFFFFSSATHHQLFFFFSSTSSDRLFSWWCLWSSRLGM